jgi:hypothetical protein
MTALAVIIWKDTISREPIKSSFENKSQGPLKKAHPGGGGRRGHRGATPFAPFSNRPPKGKKGNLGEECKRAQPACVA